MSITASPETLTAMKVGATNERLPIEVTDLTVAYKEQPVLWDVDLEAPEGVLMAIVGPNGAGKSTLIKAILGLVPTAAGQRSHLRQALS